MRAMRGVRAAAVLAVVLVAMGAAWGASTNEERQQVWDEVGRAALKGPVDVPLKDQAVLHLPSGEVFVPQPQADRLRKLLGNPDKDPAMQGIIMSRDPKASWFMPVRFETSGYIRDDDAKTWDSGKMLDDFRLGTAQENKTREKLGIPSMEILGWAQVPTYDASSQRLVWSMKTRDIGAKDDTPLGVNYNTYALGREGYVSMDMVGRLDDFAVLKPIAEQQLAALEFQPGKRYADFDATKDHVADYGLVALVVGVATQKLGTGAFFARYALVLICVGLAVICVAIALSYLRKPKARAGVAFVDTKTEPQPVAAAPHIVDVELADAPPKPGPHGAA